MKLHGLREKKLKRKNTQGLEEKIQREIIDRVFDRDSELKVKIQVQIKEQATIDALTELSSLPKEEIESIAREVRSRYEPAPEAEDKRPLVLRISGSAGVILIAVGLPLLAVVLPAVSSHIREKKEFEADKLIQAAEKGPVETVEFLLKNGGDINARGTRGRTTLMAAVEKGDLEMARFLVSRGAKVDIKDADGKTALFKAVDTGSVELSRLLLENGGDVNTRISYTDDTPLLQAAYRNNVELMALLLEHGAKTESKRYGKDNCLEWAAMNGKAESVNFLMERGMTFKYAFDWVTDAMMLDAVKGRGEDLVLVLLGKGNKYDKKRDTRRWQSAQTKLVTGALKDAARCGIGKR